MLPYLRHVSLGSSQEVFEWRRIASVCGARSPSALARIQLQALKKSYDSQLTLLEAKIQEEIRSGNWEIEMLLAELRQSYDAQLTLEELQLYLNSMVRRKFLVVVNKGGKTETARGATIKYYVLPGTTLGSEYTVTPSRSNYGEEA